MIARLERWFIAANMAAVIALLALMCVVVGWNVGLRYLTSASLSWADEVARYTMIWLTFLGAGLGLRTGVHVAITTLEDAVPAGMRRALHWIVLGGLLVFFAFMIWIGIDYIGRTGFQKSPALRLPMRHVYIAMPVGFALLAIHLLLIAPRYLRAGFGADTTEDAAMTGQTPTPDA